MAKNRTVRTASTTTDGAAGAHDAPRDNGLFPIVGIGASAGGLEAFSDLLRQLPLDTGMGFVLVQHLDPTHDSALTELLQRVTTLPVREVTNNLAVEPNHVYVIPPNTNLGISAGALILSPRPEIPAAARSIDAFFESLAEDQRERAIGVVLSGTASDGTAGLEAIKAEGGITFAQDASAKYDSMPQSAVAAGCVDFVLSPMAIAQEIARIAKHPAVGGAPDAAADHHRPGSDEDVAVTANGFKKIMTLLRNHAGVDFSQYKPSTIQRRITRRMVLSKQDTPAEYATFLRGNARELEALYSDVLINVTSFFRNPQAFEVLQRTVWPELLKQRSDDPVRVWVLGCSTGQEAYSIAMTFTEAADKAPRVRALQIFATDLSDGLLEKARHGLYPKSIAQDVSPERLQRFFVEEENGFRISKTLREKIVFARQNAVSDPPFSKMDLISCRNLLIYLEPGLQKRLFPTFHYALKPGGFLYLGASESIGAFTDLFEPLDKKQKIYRKQAAPAPALQSPPPRQRSEPSLSRAASPEHLKVAQDDAFGGLGTGLTAQREADRIAVTQFAPPAVLINADLQVVQFRGPTGDYLEPPKGKPNFDILKMARNGLMLPLRTAINEARKEKRSVRKEGVRIEQDGKARMVDVEVIPLKNLQEQCFLIVFDGGRRSQAVPPAMPGRSAKASRDAHVQRVAELEAELLETREFLQSLQERYESAHEELQASTEEIQSSNEELQSINEELETSKEELESANEELITLNEEMATRNAELNRLNTDLINAREYAENIIETVREPLLVLDAGLRVERVNRSFCRMFGVSDGETRGRRIYELGNGEWDGPGLRMLLEGVLLRNAVIENFSVTHDFEQLGTRTMLLNARRVLNPENDVERILLAIEDITERVAVEKNLAESDRHKDEFLALLAHELRGPLAPILMSIEIVRRARELLGMDDSPVTTGELNRRIDRALDVLRGQVGQMVRLVDDLLDAGRISRGKIDLRRQRVELSSVVYHALEAVRPLSDSRAQDVTVTLPDVPVYVDADPTRLAQIIGNLLNNACKFTDRGGHICLTVENDDEHVVIRVRDTGIGIAANQLEHVFEMFAQVDTSLERSRTGLGIGLTLAKTLAQMHGGSVNVSSAGLGHGSEFVVRLPVDTDAPALLSRETLEETPAATPLRILVVDDNHDSADMMAVLLRLAGHETHLAHDGLEAVAEAARIDPDVVLMDIGLPQLNGYEAARRIRQRQGDNNRPVVVALTGWGQEADRRRSQEAGFDAHLVKPVDQALLLKILADVGASKNE